MNMNEILIGLIIFIHELLIYFLIFGFLLSKNYLIYHIIFLPVTYIHWMTNNDKCFLTDLEYKLKNKDSPYTHDNANPFMKRFFSKFGINLTDDNTYKLTMILFVSSWLISLYKYMN
jgi:hypothetical protein